MRGPVTQFDHMRRANAQTYIPQSKIYLRNLLDKSYNNKYGVLDSTHHRMLFDTDFTGLDKSLYGDKYLRYYFDSFISFDISVSRLKSKIQMLVK